MFPEERKREILKLIQQNGKVRNLELSKLLGVSEPTIRKDIAELDQENLVIRTHGGAILNESTSTEPNFSDKRDARHEQKEAIAKLAVSIIKPHDRVLLDSGTTTYEIASNLGEIPLTVITNSLDIAQLLENKQACEVIVIGGNMRWHTRALVGPIANHTLKSLHVDVAFVGTNAINLVGCSTPNLQEAETKSWMINAAKHAYIVSDSSKIGSTSFSLFAKLVELSGLITDSNVQEDFKQHCIQQDITLLIAKTSTPEFKETP